MTLTKEKLREMQEKIIKYRGEVVNKTIDIEALLSAILNLYFAKKSKQNEFMHGVLDDEYFSLGLKIRIFKKLKLEVNKKIIEGMRRISDIRNDFAHRIPAIIPNSERLFVSFSYNRENPKEIEELYVEFVKLINEVEPELDNIFNNLVEISKKE